MAPTNLNDSALNLHIARQSAVAQDALLCADGGYAGDEFCDPLGHIDTGAIGIIKRSNNVKGFQVLPHSAVVKRHVGMV